MQLKDENICFSVNFLVTDNTGLPLAFFQKCLIFSHLSAAVTHNRLFPSPARLLVIEKHHVVLPNFTLGKIENDKLVYFFIQSKNI